MSSAHAVLGMHYYLPFHPDSANREYGYYRRVCLFRTHNALFVVEWHRWNTNNTWWIVNPTIITIITPCSHFDRLIVTIWVWWWIRNWTFVVIFLHVSETITTLTQFRGVTASSQNRFNTRKTLESRKGGIRWRIERWAFFFATPQTQHFSATILLRLGGPSAHSQKVNNTHSS